MVQKFRSKYARRSHLQTLKIYTLGFNQNHYTFTSVLLMKIVLRGTFYGTKLKNCKCLCMSSLRRPLCGLDAASTGVPGS